MNGISLFTGSGIGELTFKHIIPGYRTVCYVEWDKFCQRLIQKRITDGVLDDAPIWDDVRTFDGRPWAGRVDFVSGGFPCQPFSVAGKREADEDERNMWPDTLRIISEIRPRYALMENVTGLLSHKYFRRIQADLAGIFYDVQGVSLSASEVGASHKREREWFIAYPQSESIFQLPQTSMASYSTGGGQQGSREYTSSVYSAKDAFGEAVGIVSAVREGALPYVCRRHDGVADRMDRLRCCGNGWVPQVVARILKVNTNSGGERG